MTNFASENLRRNQDVRLHYQIGGAGPSNPAYFLGSSEAQIAFITAATLANNGATEPIWVPSPRRQGTWELQGRQRAVPEQPTISLDWHEWLDGGIPRQLLKSQCPYTFYELSDRCKDLSDINRGWSGYVMIYADGIAGSPSLGARNARTDDNPLTDSVEYTLRDSYPVGQLAFGEEAAAEVVSEVIDGVYVGVGNCGDCGLANDGSRLSYYVTRANVGSPSAPGQIVYSTDYGVTWQTAQISGIGSANQPAGIDIAGNRLFVWVPGSTNIRYATINEQTGVPGTWTAVAAAAYQDAWVQSPRSIWFVGANGAIARTRDIASAPTSVDTGAGAVQLNRIHGTRGAIVAVGASGTVRASLNNGVSWASYVVSISGVPVTDAFVAVFAHTARRWFVLASNNRLYVTENQGATWAEVPIPLAGQGAGRDIVFASPEVGYISSDVDNTAYLACTIDGGNSWSNDGARLLQYPLFEKGNRIVVPQSGVADVDTNTVGIAGLRATTGGDGVIQLGVSSKL